MIAEEVTIVKTGRKSDSLWAEATSSTADALTRTATTSNDENRSSYGIWHGKIASLQLWSFVKYGFYHRKRARKIFTKDACELVTTRDVTRLDAPETVSPAPEKARVIDATHQETQAWQENADNDHDSEEGHVGSDEKSNSSIVAERQSEGIRQEFVETLSVEPIADFPTGSEGDIEKLSTSPAAWKAARQVASYLKGPEAEESGRSEGFRSQTREIARTSMMSGKMPNVEKELDEATGFYSGLMASTPAEHHPQGSLGKHVLHVKLYVYPRRCMLLSTSSVMGGRYGT